MAQGSFDGVEAHRWLWFGPSRTRLLRIIMEMNNVEKRLAFIEECLSPDMIKSLALGVPLEMTAAQYYQRYFSNTPLLRRHVHIAERLHVLLFGAHQFSDTPEPLPSVFYNWLIPYGIGRLRHDITNWFIRFLNTSLENPTDARPLIFGLICRLMTHSPEEVDRRWLQSCTEAVAISIWFSPRDQSYGTRRKPEHTNQSRHVKLSAEWYHLCQRMIQHLQNRYHLYLTTSRRPNKGGGEAWRVRVDTPEFYTRILLEMGENYDMPPPPLQSYLIRWLTIWTFHCLGGMNDDWINDSRNKTPHELVQRGWIVCKLREETRRPLFVRPPFE